MKTGKFNPEHLQQLRETKGWSQSDVIFKLHDAGLTLSRPTYDKYEKTGDDLEVKDLEVIAKVFQEPLENFFCS